MSSLPLLSSKQIIRALKRAGFSPSRKAKGSHQAMEKTVGNHTIVTIVVLGKKEVPRSTLKSIIRLAEMTISEFLDYL